MARNIEIRGIAHMTAFRGTIHGMHGIWWRDQGGVYALDVRLASDGQTRVPFMRKPVNQYSYHASADAAVTDYEGPLDLRISVKCFSPWRGNGRRDVGPSHVEVKYVREKDMRKGPRAIRIREHDDETSGVG